MNARTGSRRDELVALIRRHDDRLEDGRRPTPAFFLDRFWTIVEANRMAKECGIKPGTHFFELMFDYCRRPNLPSPEELETWQMEMVRALTYFESFFAARSSQERQLRNQIMYRLNHRFKDADGSANFSRLRELARQTLRRFADRYSTLDFAQPITICTVSLSAPFNSKFILRFDYNLQRLQQDYYVGLLIPQSVVTAEAIELLSGANSRAINAPVIKAREYHYGDLIHALANEGSSADYGAEGYNPYRQEMAPTEEERRQEQLERLTDELEDQGVAFNFIPERLYAGMRYVTPGALVESGVTRYSQQHILALIRRRLIPAYHFANRVVLDAVGVQRLRERERQSVAEHVHVGRRRSGRHSHRRRHTPPAQIA